MAVLAFTGTASAQPGLTAAPQLSKAYDLIVNAQFEEVPGFLARTCPPAPSEACQLLQVVSLWWEIQLDPDNRTRDALFQKQVDAAIAATEAWAAREPKRAEAWFYVGGAYGARVQFRVLRGNQLAAARDGKKIKEALERALDLDPTLHDAWFGIGLYHYYADIAPTVAKMFRWLLALPGGSREEGLAEMLRARERGQLLRSEADYQLHVVYLWYEKNPERALELLEGLRGRHPHNPHFPASIGFVEDEYLLDYPASLRTYQALLVSARVGRVAEKEIASAAGHLGAAKQLDQLFETDAAIPHLRAVIDSPTAPPSFVAEARRRLERYTERLAEPAYKLSLHGWRAYEKRDYAEAGRLLAQALAADRTDPVIQYRYAKVLLAQKRDEDALLVLSGIHKRHEETPPIVYTLACVDAARVKERQGDLRVAADLYRTATTVFGGDRRAKIEAQKQYVRLAASLK